MRLADYIEQHADRIVDDAQAFAATQLPGQVHLDPEALRDHLPQILDAIVVDLRHSQTPGEELQKALGYSDTQSDTPSAAQWHGGLRAKEGFSIQHLVAEFRALRASVLRLWSTHQSATEESFDDLMRFNQAIDQAVAESVTYYAREQESWRQIFLGVLGHDLRDPLNAIMLTSELMSKMTGDAPISRQAQRLISSGRRMSVLLDDLLDYSRTALGMGIRIKPTRVDLSAEIADEIETLRAAWPQVPIVFRVPPPIRVEVDASRLREALSNLVGNAAKYGAAASGVQVSLERNDGRIFLRVQNSGVTIPPEVLATLFDPLRRGMHDDGHGTSLGLGLFIAREVAKAHGGTIEATSEDGSTIFTISLPDRPLT